MDQTSPAQGALDHLRVIDMSRVLAGPWAAQNLADLGADVIKIENPSDGDDTRKWGPPFLENDNSGRGDAAYFTACNRNKRSVTVDFATAEGAQIIRDLVQTADILIENYKVGGLKKYGLAYEDLKEINPGLIYCSVTGFGQTGPYANRPGYDFLIQGMGGLMSITGQQDGEPLKVGVAVCDLFTGMNATVAILAALAHRTKTGEGQHIDCSLLAGQISMLANQASSWLVGGIVPEPMGNNHPTVVPYRVYPTANGNVVITCGNDGQFRRLCKALGADDLLADPRFTTNADRVNNRGELDRLLTDLLSTRTRDEAVKTLEAENVSCGPINTIPDVFADPHVQARKTEITLQRPDGTRIPTVAFPSRLSATPATYRRAPPVHGADTDTVLSELLGLSDTEIDRLRRCKAI